MASTTRAAGRAAPRRAPAAKRAQPSSAAAAPGAETPIGADVFNLDAVKHEATDAPFTFQCNGRLWSLCSPEELDWQEHADATRRAMASEPRPFLKLLLGEQYEEFIDLRIKLGQVNALVLEWQRYYGLALPES
jgi:hypothetical protein